MQGFFQITKRRTFPKKYADVSKIEIIFRNTNLDREFTLNQSKMIQTKKRLDDKNI